ncbi:unnamed protein product [Clonostachys solani]|uniref:Rhomboid family membrane protein n=1 Tax=Clonostachys solani TaxID=160281 RepID=A0A9N9ZD56_9HYPO|nr:unnamed protein product [Clonostachys solani]
MSVEPTDRPLPERFAFIHNGAIAGAVIAPLAMLLPPRKVDLRFFVLVGTFSLSTNYLAYAYTGTSIYGRFQNRISPLFDVGLPAEAKKTRQLLQEHRQREAALKGTQEGSEAQQKSGLAKAVEDVWMGGQDADWQQKRAEEHQKSLEEGKGLYGIIIDQISDVWSGTWKPQPKKTDSESTEAPASERK